MPATAILERRSAMRKPIEATNNLRRLREASGWTQRDIAARIGVMPTVVRQYEHGRQIPESTRTYLAGLFGVSVEHLMGWDR